MEEERGLALVNLTEMVYYVYKSVQKNIEKRKVAKILGKRVDGKSVDQRPPLHAC